MYIYVQLYTLVYVYVYSCTYVHMYSYMLYADIMHMQFTDVSLWHKSMQHGEESCHGLICKLKDATLETAKLRIQCFVDSNVELTTRASQACRASSAAVGLKLLGVESCLAHHHNVAQRIGFWLLCLEQDLIFMPQVSVVKRRVSFFKEGRCVGHHGHVFFFCKLINRFVDVKIEGHQIELTGYNELLNESPAL